MINRPRLAALEKDEYDTPGMAMIPKFAAAHI
jgi:hypothetical protein